MDPDDQAEAERRVKAMRRKKAREFGERVETWLRPPKRLDSDLANDLARLMAEGVLDSIVLYSMRRVRETRATETAAVVTATASRDATGIAL